MGIVKHVLAFSFNMGDCEDPELYAAQPIWEWQQTDAGKFIMENSVTDPYFTCVPDVAVYGYKVMIKCDLTEKDFTYFTLKWGGNVYTQ
jgi:SUMO ligase MMS21 Smc5/6 complex component